MPHPLWSNFFRRREPQNRRIARLWGETTLFRDVPQRAIRQLTDGMHPRRYQSDERIFSRDDRGAGAALILSGQVEIRVGGALLATLGEGDFFGEVALAVDERRTADAVATEGTEVVFFLRHELEEWIEQSPREGARLALNLSLILAERLRRANQMIEGEERS